MYMEKSKTTFDPHGFFLEHKDEYWVGVNFTNYILDHTSPFNLDEIEECFKPITITLVSKEGSKPKELEIKTKPKEQILLSAANLLYMKKKKDRVILGYVLGDQDDVVRVASATFKKGVWRLWCEKKIEF